MQSPRVLHEGALPGDRHRQKERVESWVVEALADVAARRDEDAFLEVGDRGESFTNLAVFARAHSALQDDHVASGLDEVRR